MKNISVIAVIILSIFIFSCKKTEIKTEQVNINATENKSVTTENYIIEFVELGSVNCIPCRKMQPIMESVQKKYGGQVKVTFYDVWKNPEPGERFGIQLIPTQVFLNAQGVELMRHEGFFPEAEIDKFLQSHGLKIVN